MKEKNASLTLRNAHFTKLKILDQIGRKRSTFLVDASLFTNAFHTGDYLLQNQEPVLLDPAQFHGIKPIAIHQGSFSTVEKVSLLDGETVMCKYHLDGAFGPQELATLSHEHRLLTFIGKHSNIVNTIGLVHSSKKFSHVLQFQSGMTLSKIVKPISSLLQLKGLLNGIIEGLNFLFEKGVLHNHLVADNIIFDGYKPIIIGFTFACRVDTAKFNIADVLKKFHDQHHFAPELFKGAKVSFGSDMFSFGVLLKLILKRKINFDIDDCLETRLTVLADHCLKRNPKERPAYIFLADRVKVMLEAA